MYPPVCPGVQSLVPTSSVTAFGPGSTVEARLGSKTVVKRSNNGFEGLEIGTARFCRRSMGLAPLNPSPA